MRRFGTSLTAADVRVRRAEVADAPGLRAIMCAAAEEDCGMLAGPGEVAGLASVRRRLKVQAWFVAEAGGRVIGYLAAVRGKYRATRHRAEVVVCLGAEWRGKGIGRLLLDAAVAWADANGVMTMVAHVRAGNARSVRLFASRGFEAVADLPGEVMRADGSIENVHVLSRRVGPIPRERGGHDASKG